MAVSLIDPLQGLSVLSLLSRTFKGLKETANSEDDDLEAILSNLKPLERKSTDVHLEEAKTVLSGCSVSQGDELQQDVMESVGMFDDVPPKVKDRPQERRPALGRKRARFSLKPNTSQPSLDVDASLNIGQLQDPEDFFSAFEKLENAKRELQKQRGETLMDSTQHKPFMRSRNRRPGILGKTAGYKHRYSSVATDGSDEALDLSQGTVEVGVSNLSSDNRRPETTDQLAVSQEREFSGAGHEDIIQGSAAEVDNRVNSLLDELLSDSSINLDGDGTVSLLEEHLQIKPINLGKFSVPDFDSLRKSDSKAPVEWLARPRTPLSNIHNIVTRINTKISEDTQKERPAYSRASPAQPKSPFSSLSMLKKRIALSDPPDSPFTFHSMDMSSPSHSSPLGIDKETPSAHGDTANLNANGPTPALIDGNRFSFSGKSQPLSIEENDAAGSDTVLGKVAEDLACRLEPMDGKSNRFSIDNSLQANGSGCGLEDKDEDLQQENVTSKDPELGCQGSNPENFHCSENRLDDSEPTSEDHPVGRQSDVEDIIPDPNNEDNQEPPRTPSDVQSKQRGATRTRRKRKEVASRKSLAGVGTLWESGVRRSTRIRMRPLEYWKGERFLYGRVHESLLTVIGCKYESPPTGGGKPRLKVKSFVSDEFKELVEKAALH